MSGLDALLVLVGLGVFAALLLASITFFADRLAKRRIAMFKAGILPPGYQWKKPQ